VRTYREDGGTVIRFHEDRYRMGERHTVERSARLIRFGAELREALQIGLDGRAIPSILPLI
jgi:hypothetical protein